MPKIKEVLSSEVHWQVAGWNTKDQANIRIRQLLGSEAEIFAPVYVTHGGYYWSDAEASGWTTLTDASEADRAEAMAVIEGLRSRTVARFPQQKARIEQIFNWPNDDFVFLRRGEAGLVVRLTGWGFANYNRARGGSIIEAPAEDNIHDVKLAFLIDGMRVPSRSFEIMQGLNWAPKVTDSDGLYDLGRVAPGEVVHVRDSVTGREHSESIGKDTELVEVDVTEFVTVRLNATYDGEPIGAEEASINYGHRSQKLVLADGVAECRMPWLEGMQCEVMLRDARQRRELVRESANVFDFRFVSPKRLQMQLVVRVSADGVPVLNEPVDFEFNGTARQMLTDESGCVKAVFEQPETEGGAVTVSVRDRSVVEPVRDGEHTVEFAFDTDPGEIFNGMVRTVNLDGDVVKLYPITIDSGKGPLNYITDELGRVTLQDLVSGTTMTVADATDARTRQDFVLDSARAVYDFVLPYRSTKNEGDCTLRVIEANKRPSSGTTAVLVQDDKKIIAHLDKNGEMRFGSDDFSVEKPVTVCLSSLRRTFPELKLQLEKDEKEYEIKEVVGTPPWWAILLEIGLALFMCFALYFLYYMYRALIYSLPNIFS